MPTKLAIPDLAIALDFMGEDYQEARVELSNKIINDTLAAMSLVNLWVISNNKDKLAWAQQVEEENLVAEKKSQRLSEDIATQQKCLADKQDSAWQEERKRNKLKYAPKMKAGDYCILHQQGLEEALRSMLTTDAKALVMLPSANGIHTWVPAGTVRDTKVPVTMDKNLTWEQFNKSAPRMVTFIQEHDWVGDRVTMHLQFWSALQTPAWRYSFDPVQQRALLLYQV
ncbi:hypothetical protein SERLA73DRAFT_156352 [Serpula lacrymans var. lacrymans S7.3]|uniref:Uncharacterized protein n=1 Tax=Serpula lacrymans var. lacrymans (strain S7.3) TaxID=936435 RepID=F8QE40_SERL3|nr:hypothetical protein SERLA73DRAFT_156352 [Serpula lacrymans var. lacrymans S7.3]